MIAPDVASPFSIRDNLSADRNLESSLHGRNCQSEKEKSTMKNLYVGNLPHSATESQLRGLFEVHGAVERVSIVTDRETGRARGFAFVEMTNAGEADKAVAALNGSDLAGRALKINEAKPKTESPRGGGKRFGGGGGSIRDDYQGHARQPREPRW